MNKQLKIYKCKVIVKKTVDIVVAADSEESALKYLGSDDDWHEVAVDISCDIDDSSFSLGGVSEIKTIEDSPWPYRATDIPFGGEAFDDAGIAERLYSKSNPFPACYNDDAENERAYSQWYEKLKTYQIEFDKIRKRPA